MLFVVLTLLAATPESANSVVKDTMVCKPIMRTGSRLAPRKVCKLASEWRFLTERARDDTEQLQRKTQPEQLPVF